MSYEKLFAEVKKLNEKYTNILEELCNIESPTNFKEGVDKVAYYFADMAKEKGWKVEILKQEVAGDVVCITLNPEVNEKPISLSSHLDTVHPIGLFGYPPVKRDLDKMYGPGVLDCKGGAVTAFMAMDALEKIGFKKRPVMLLLQTDEEVGSSISNLETINYICEKAKGSVGFINLEGCIGATAVLQRKGVLRIRFDIKGKAEHSSRCFQGASAITEAAHKIIQLEKLKDKEGITCNCGIINGGTTANTVAETCSFTADIRYSTNQELQKIMKIVENVSKNNTVDGCSCAITKLGDRPAMPRCDKNDKFLETINNIFEKCDLQKLSARFAFGGSDAAYSTQAGIPTVDSFGTEGGNIHSIDEFIYLKSIAESAKKIAAVCYGI